MDDLYGPPLPPGYVKPSDNSINSANCVSQLKSSKLPNTHEIKDELPLPMIGPALPQFLTEHDESSLNDMCGPSLHEFGSENDAVNDRKADINKKAEKMKYKLDNKNVETNRVEREEWMIVPDTSRKNQLGAISRCLAPPSKEKKKERVHQSSEKDKKTSEELKKYNKSRRAESLMDMHAKKLKTKEKSEKSKRKEDRKAFDRDEMAVRHFSNKQVNSVIDKAKFLNSRFASSASNKYL